MIPALAIGAAVWCVLSTLALPGYVFAVGRLRRRARTYTDWTLSQPDVPPLRTVSDEDYAADQPPPLVLADWTLDELQQAVTWHEFVDLMWAEFPQYRRDFTGGAA